MSLISSLGGTSGATPATAATLNAPKAAPATTSSNQSPDFMKLLMAQMQNQNPMNPQSSNDYITQMAQFSTVQGITQLNQSITSMVALQGLTQGVSLIGKTVTYTNAAGNTASGTVGSVAMVGGQPQLVINNTNVSLSQIQSIQAGARKAAATSGTTSATTGS
jgi:flagellar basal-body rod modification protein FlgD